jgi:hypothetical protein
VASAYSVHSNPADCLFGSATAEVVVGASPISLGARIERPHQTQRRRIASIPARDLYAWDDELPGFGVRVKPSGVWSPRRLIVLEFPSLARAREWYASPEYAPLIALRESTARTAPANARRC